MKHHPIRSFIAAALVATFFPACADPAGTPGALPASQMPPSIQKLIDEGYTLKKDGENARALEKFELACDGLRAAGLNRTPLFASCLDDRASVMLRIGRTDEAASLFRLASATLGPAPAAADKDLKSGIRERLAIITSMKEQGITCAEPASPDPADKRPYFPDVTAVQEALGTLTRAVAPCGGKKVLEAISMRLLVTSDGKLLLVDARDKYAGTEREKCVVQKLRENIATVKLPPFRACFRAFTVPFVLGPHPPQDTPASTTAPASNAVPPENTEGKEPPSVDSAVKGAQLILDAFRENTPDAAMPFFFPADKFEIVKDILSPSRYHRKLVEYYLEDMNIDGPRFRHRNWKVQSVKLGRCRWKEPGTEGNKVAYWSCIGNTVSVIDSDETRRFDIRVLIDWGPSWYVTHLGPIHN